MILRRLYLLILLLALSTISALAQVKAPLDDVAPEESQNWTITGPPGGDVRSVVIDPSNSNRAFLGTADGQIYNSIDAGKHWTLLRPGLGKASLSVDNIIVDPKSPNIIYAGVHTNDSIHGGVYISDDSGLHWRSLPGIENHSVRALAIAPSDNSVLVAGAIDGVFRTIDAGRNWTRISPENHPELKNFESIAIDPRSPDTIYAGTFHLPWKTTNGGQDWVNIKNGMLDDSDVFAIEIDRAKPEHVIASACSGIYETQTGGEKWRKVAGIPFSARRTRDITQNPARPNEIYAGTTEGLWRTTDGGDSWMLITSTKLVINSIAIHPDNPNRVLLGTDDAGIMVSEDGGQNFAVSNDGFVNRQVAALVADPRDAQRIYAGVIYDGLYGGFFLSEDGGKTWSQSNKGMGPRDVFSLYQPANQPSTIYAGTNNGLYRSDDRGINWTRLEKQVEKPKVIRRTRSTATRRTVAQHSKKRPAPKPEAKPEDNTPKIEYVNLNSYVLEITPTNDGKDGLLAATWEGLYRTYDTKQGWEKLGIADYQGRVYTVNTSASAPGMIFAGTSQGLYISKDDGQSWIRPKGGPLQETVQSVAIDPNNTQFFLVGTRRTVYRTTDGGESWSRRGGGLPFGDYSVISINPQNPKEIITSTSEVGGGIYHSLDSGITWHRIDGGLPSQRLWSISFDPFNPNRAYAGSFSGGIYILNRIGEVSSR